MRRCQKLAEYKEVIITNMISARKILIENRLLRNSEEIELFERSVFKSMPKAYHKSPDTECSVNGGWFDFM